MLERANGLVPNAAREAAQGGERAPGVSMGDVFTAAGELVDAVSQLNAAGRSFLDRHADERPYVLLGVAAGIGFVVGGGLASRTSLGLLALGGRLVAARIWDQLVAVVPPTRVDGNDSNVQPPSGSENPRRAP